MTVTKWNLLFFITDARIIFEKKSLLRFYSVNALFRIRYPSISLDRFYNDTLFHDGYMWKSSQNSNDSRKIDDG